jgi:DNA-binding response OmpR family regulator
MREALSSIASCVDFAQSGEVALKLIDAYAYSVIFLDAMLPDDDAYRDLRTGQEASLAATSVHGNADMQFVTRRTGHGHACRVRQFPGKAHSTREDQRTGGRLRPAAAI